MKEAGTFLKTYLPHFSVCRFKVKRVDLKTMNLLTAWTLPFLYALFVGSFWAFGLFFSFWPPMLHEQKEELCLQGDI